MLLSNVEFSPDIVITNSKKPDSIENTLATRFKASVLLVKLPVKKTEKLREAMMLSADTISPVVLMFFSILASI